jgi:hypothetical protein
MQTEVIDLYYMHCRDVNVPIEETVGAMAESVCGQGSSPRAVGGDGRRVRGRRLGASDRGCAELILVACRAFIVGRYAL